MRAQRDRDRGVHARQLLDGERVGQRVAAAAAVLLGERDSHQVELAELLDDLVGEGLRAVELLGDRRDLALGEFAHRAPDQLVLGGEVEVHARGHSHRCRSRMDPRVSRRRLILDFLTRGRTYSYGPHRSQRADLYLPLGAGPHPVMVLVHGGSWHERYGKVVMRGLAGDLSAAAGRCGTSSTAASATAAAGRRPSRTWPPRSTTCASSTRRSTSRA